MIFSSNQLKALLLLQLAATCAMTGLIWFVQIVHYPLFGKVGVAEFVRYHADHTQLTSWVVEPPMLVELACAIVLVISPPAAIGRSLAVLGLVLVGLIWVSTGMIQVPLHDQLAGGFNRNAYAKLVQTNWIRTVLWSARSGLAAWMLWKAMPEILV
jgi:hypothetical protein